MFLKNSVCVNMRIISLCLNPLLVVCSSLRGNEGTHEELNSSGVSTVAESKIQEEDPDIELGQQFSTTTEEIADDNTTVASELTHEGGNSSGVSTAGESKIQEEDPDIELGQQFSTTTDEIADDNTTVASELEQKSDLQIGAEESQNTQTFVTHDGESIVYRIWEPVGSDPKAVVYIVHGMAEHSGRYDPFARQMVEQLGVRVISPDQRGHGLTSTKQGRDDEKLGEFRKGSNAQHKNAISLMGHDINELIYGTYQDLPVIVFGHSMGSVVARTALRIAEPRMGGIVKGLILSGVPTAPHWLELYPLHAVANIVKSTGLGHELVQRTFTHFKFDAPVRSRAKDPELPVNCFVSSDLEECKKFNEDPYTNHLVDAEILFSIVKTLAELEKATYFGPPSVDVLFVTGREDPVASFGTSARSDADRMIKAGHQVTELYLSRSRHEFLREKEPIRKEGTNQVIAWIRSKLDL
jgi:alpha-beta hydrolase superfamily lysophospholipase